MSAETSPFGENLATFERRMEQAEAEVYTCLRAIREGKLYRDDGYKSFEEYALKRWGYSKSHAYRLIDYGKVVERLKADGCDIIPTEGQARKVLEGKSHALKTKQVKSEDDFLDRAANTLKIAVDTADKRFDVPRVTTEHIIQTKERFGGGPAKPKIHPDVQELVNAVKKVAGCTALAKGDGHAFRETHGEVMPNSTQFVCDWLAEYLSGAD